MSSGNPEPSLEDVEVWKGVLRAGWAHEGLAVEAMTALVCASWTVPVPLTNDDVDLVCEAVLHHLQRPHTRMAKCAPLFFGNCNVLNTPAGNRTLGDEAVPLAPEVRDKLGTALVGCLAHPTMGLPHPEDDNDFCTLDWHCTGASNLHALILVTELVRTGRRQGTADSLACALVDAGVNVM